MQKPASASKRLCQVKGCTRKAVWGVLTTLVNFAGLKSAIIEVYACGPCTKAHEAKTGKLKVTR